MIENVDVVCRACSMTNTIQVVYNMSQTSALDRVCQIIIAAFAAIGTVVGLFKCRIDKKLNSPILDIRFSCESPYYDVEEMSAPGEVGVRGNRKILLKVGVENNGPYMANGCNIKLLSVSLTDGGEEIRLPATNLRKNLKRIGNVEDGNSIQSGGMCLLELGEIGVDKDEKLAGNPGDPPAASAACLALHCSDGTVECLRPHQSHVNIIVNLCADDFIPRKYLLNIDWKGRSVADIGTAGAFSCSSSCIKK